jgi:hypothetical protein
MKHPGLDTKGNMLMGVKEELSRPDETDADSSRFIFIVVFGVVGPDYLSHNLHGGSGSFHA